MNDTKTPRTDAEATLSCDFGLRSAFVVHVEFARELEREIARLTAERDEARRSCCEYAAIVDGADTGDGMESGCFYEIAMKYMKDRGWDCFKEDG